MRQGIKEKDIRDFEKYASKLADVMERIMKYNPEANCYVTMNDIRLFGTRDIANGYFIYGNAPQAVAIVDIPGIDSGELHEY